MSISREMDTEDVVHIYNGILLSRIKEWKSNICKDLIDLETVIQSEISQKEKNKYHFYMESGKIL